jgi:hypothetical protein
MKFKPAYPMVATLAPGASAGVTMAKAPSMGMQMGFFYRVNWNAR